MVDAVRNVTQPDRGQLERSHYGVERRGFEPPTRRQVFAFLTVLVPLIGVLLAVGQALIRGVRPVEITIFVVFYILSLLGVTLGYHRLFTHNAFKTSDPMRFVLGLLGSISGQGPLLSWVHDHSRHHAFSDTQEDPHSPRLHGDDTLGRLRGLWHSHIAWMFGRDETPWSRFVINLLRDPVAFWLHRHYTALVLGGLLLPALVGWAFIGGWQGALVGFLWGGLVRMFAVNQLYWCVASVCHMFGSRPFPGRAKDLSANNWWIALVTFGDGNQNNHHAFPSSAAHGLRWWEPDLAYCTLRLLRRLGLVWDVKLPSRTELERAYTLGRLASSSSRSNS